MNLNKLTKIFEIMKENLPTETIDKKNIANKKIIEAGYKPKDKHEDMIKKYIESIELCFDDKK